MAEREPTGEGVADPPESERLDRYLERWLDHQRLRLRPRTVERYAQLLRLHVAPRIGHLRLDAIRPDAVQACVDAVMHAGRSGRTALHVHRVLFSALRQAQRWGLVDANPAARVQPPRPERPHLEIPSPGELVALLARARGTRWEIPVLLLCATGARRGEVLGLAWSAVDLARGRIRIERSLQRVPRPGVESELVFLEPKSFRSRRSVALPAFAAARLAGHADEQASRRRRLGEAWRDLDLVCERGDGAPFDPGEFSRAVKRFVREEGLPDGTRLHDIRHAVATVMLEAGVHPAIASAVLGHASPAFTMATYQHVLDGMTEVAADAIEQALGPGDRPGPQPDTQAPGGAE